MKLSRILIVLAVTATIGTAAFASAAITADTVPKLGADVDAVASCDAAVTTTWDSAYEAAIGEFEVTTVTVSAIVDVACLAATLKVQLVKAADVALGTTVSAVIAATETSKILDFSGQSLKASEVDKVAVILTGP